MIRETRVNTDGQIFSVSTGNLNPPKLMHYHRKPAFALLLCSFKAYLKAILRNETNTALVFSFPSSEWMQEGMQNYLELGPCQEHFLGLSVRGCASENTFQISTAWKPVLQRFASSTFHSPSTHKLSSSHQQKMVLSIPLFQAHLRSLQKARPIVLMAAREKSLCFSEELGLLHVNKWLT